MLSTVGGFRQFRGDVVHSGNGQANLIKTLYEKQVESRK